MVAYLHPERNCSTWFLTPSRDQLLLKQTEGTVNLADSSGGVTPLLVAPVFHDASRQVPSTSIGTQFLTMYRELVGFATNVILTSLHLHLRPSPTINL